MAYTTKDLEKQKKQQGISKDKLSYAVAQGGNAAALAGGMAKQGINAAKQVGYGIGTIKTLLNKPKDYVTTSDDPQQRKTVMDLVKNACEERIYPVGRLDRNTTGVLLLTNDGDLASKLTHPKFLKKKVYHVYLDKPVTATDLQKIAEGIELEDGEVHADAIEYASPTDEKQVGIEIHSGKNRIVRRIFGSIGFPVKRLVRTQIGPIKLGDLKPGSYRVLSQTEVRSLSKEVGL